MKTAIITGQSRGLGKALAERFLAAGYNVPRCTRQEMDVTNGDSISNFISTFGELHILINNAAILGPVTSFCGEYWREWENTLTTNIVAPAYLTRILLNKMPPGSRIINIAGGGACNPLPRRSAYATSKAALVRFTECIAEELRERNITANCVLPGPLPTGMRQAIVDAGEEVETPAADAMQRAVDLCLWLASENAGHATGRCVSARYDRWPFYEGDMLDPDRFTLRRESW